MTDPSTSCIVAGWLVGVQQPAQTVVAEVLALADDGYLEVVADEDGYVFRRGPADPAGLWEDRAAVLAGLLHGGDPVRLPRPMLPPVVPPQGPISAGRLRNAVSRTSERYGFVSRLRWLMPALMLLGVTGAVVAGIAGRWTAAAWTGLGCGLLGIAWLRMPVWESPAARAERDRLLDLREKLLKGAADPELLPWAYLLLSDGELEAWWRRARPVTDRPGWLTWTPVGEGRWPGLLTNEGLHGLTRTIAHRMGP
jgi:hypothetical protein